MARRTFFDVPSLEKQMLRLAQSIALIRDRDWVALGEQVSPVQYEDEEFTYIEVELPGQESLECDICLCGGRTVIRFAR
ncbi:hypothetical protein [Aquisphaera giovannonii]|uniref:hypothetical protein n=1 Tax=Aquisphaera giovannonii TaxID=406548 RepID=UPI0011DFD6C9|nr:hypothetical protein [Aquisphaera giovannonii]